MNELTIKNFDALELNELETIDGGLSWRDVATAGGALLGSTFGGPLGGFAGGIIAGGIYDVLT